MVTLNQVTPEVAPQLRKPQQLLDVRGITKCFGGITALENVSLQLGEGEVLGLLGANGSGKTTLSRIVAAEIRPNAGQILVGGEPLARASPKEAKRRRIAIAHQHPSLPPHFPVWESIFFGAELTYTGGILRRARERERAARLLESLGANVGGHRSSPANLRLRSHDTFRHFPRLTFSLQTEQEYRAAGIRGQELRSSDWRLGHVLLLSTLVLRWP